MVEDNNMARIEVNLEVKRPVCDVFNYWVDVKSWPEWSLSLDKLEFVSNDPICVGSKIKGVTRHLGRPWAWTATVIEYNPCKLCAFIIETSAVTLTEHDTFESMNSGTKTHSVLEIKGKGFIKLLLPLLIGSFKRSVTQDTARLQYNLESRK
jgi:uncharacterized membrane protein